MVGTQMAGWSVDGSTQGGRKMAGSVGTICSGDAFALSRPSGESLVCGINRLGEPAIWRGINQRLRRCWRRSIASPIRGLSSARSRSKFGAVSTWFSPPVVSCRASFFFFFFRSSACGQCRSTPCVERSATLSLVSVMNSSTACFSFLPSFGCCWLPSVAGLLIGFLEY